MKKIISIILTLTIISSLIAVIPAQAASYYEGSYTLTGIQVNDMIGIAKTQVGYMEGNNSSQLDGTISGSGNYTKYAEELKKAGYSASNPNAWCAYFVSWCAMKAGCLNSALPFFTGVKSSVARSKPYKSNGIGTYHAIKKHTFTKGSVFSKDYTPSNIENYKPQKGDIMVYKSHVGLVTSDYNSNTNSFTVIDGNNNNKVRNRTVYMNNSNLVGFITPDYSTTTITPTHSHSYSFSNDTAHPHAEYKYCSCGTKEYTGIKKLNSSCKQCYPVGNVKLTREFEKTKGTATFYRNSVSNATNYTLKVYRNDNLYNTYDMSSDKYYVSGLPSGEYYATLYAKNTATGEERNDSCPEFKAADSYTVSYNANGGTNAPSSQTKIEDTNLTLTSAIPTKEGHIFKGWASSKNAIEAQYQAGGNYTKNAKITLYAVWEPETYIVTFDTNGGTGIVADEKVTYGNTIKMPNSVIKDYAYLKGWSVDKNSTKVDYSLNTDYKIKQNLTLYAVWGDASWDNEISISLSGKGTQEEPYLISTAADLAYLANKVNTQTSAPSYEYYKLTDNINLNYNEWKPIGIYGDENQYFYGSFDGNGYTVSDMFISSANEGYVGLFGYVKDSLIQNLNITGVIEGISTSASVNIGGIIGYAEQTEAKNLSSLYFNIGGLSVGTANATKVGTIIGISNNGTIKHCISSESHIALKSGKFEAGMIVGQSSSDIIDCSVIVNEDGLFSSSSTINEFYVGGLCGTLNKSAEKCTVTAPYMSNNIMTNGQSSVGGLVGQLNGNLKLCTVKFTGDNSSGNSMKMNGVGSTSIGGFVGTMTKNAIISDCKYDGESISATTTSGSTNAGGIVGTIQVKTNLKETLNLKGGERIYSSSLPTKEGYIAELYSDYELTDKVNLPIIVDRNTALYIKWIEDIYSDKIWDGTYIEPQYNSSTKTYLITEARELAWIAQVTNGNITTGENIPVDKSFSGCKISLVNDIYLNEPQNWKNYNANSCRLWNSIGNKSCPFKGTFYGNGFTVFGMYISTASDYAGLFGYVADGEINGIQLDKSVIVSNGNYVGGIAGYVANNTTIKNCRIYANIFGYHYVGGIVGYCYGYNVKINNCSNHYSVDATGNYCGGIIGYSVSDDIEYCVNEGTVGSVDTQQYVGGIVGYSNNIGRYYDNYISSCYNTGLVIGNTTVGGIVGGTNYINEYTTCIENCYNSGMVKGVKQTAGGIVGGNFGIVNNCYSRAVVTGGSKVGGIVGFNGYSGAITKCYSTGTFSSSDSYVGSICGYETGGTLKWCYSTIAGLYYSAKAGTISYVSTKTTSQIKTLSNLTGFDSLNWGTDSSVNNGYPYLKTLEETYKNFDIAFVEPTDIPCIINNTFANISGSISSSANYSSSSGGIVGTATGSTGSVATANNIIVFADEIDASTTGTSYNGYAGYLVGNANNYLSFDNAYYDAEMALVSSSNTMNTDGIEKSKRTINSNFFATTMGLTPYTTLSNLENNHDAIWILKNGELPELYYNCLNDITISKDIVNGTVTADKSQAVDGEIVTVTAIPNNNYVVNKIFVNGEEKDSTFIMNGDCEIYVTFTEKVEEYNVSISANENATGTLVNVDSTTPMLMSVMSVSDEDNSTITAKDGEEILINTIADTDYTVDTIYVNGEELTGNSFILDDNSVVTMDVTSIKTNIEAITDDVVDVGCHFAVVSGSVSNEDENAVKYIRYWSADNAETIYTTDIETGSGYYIFEIEELNPETTYYYQMTEVGEVKSFTTSKEPIDEYECDENSGADENGSQPITATTYKTLASTYKFSIECSQALTTEFLAIACYDSDGKLLVLKQVECDGDTFYTGSVPIDTDIDYSKIFVWSAFSSLKPLTGVEIVDIIE